MLRRKTHCLSSRSVHPPDPQRPWSEGVFPCPSQQLWPRLRDGRQSCALGLAAMLKKTLRTNYRRKLAHVVVLTDGTKLVTLRDAVNVLLDAANARSGGLDNAIRLLLLAAKTGKRADMVEATEAIERVLRARRLL